MSAKKAKVIDEQYVLRHTDPTRVENKDPDLKYHWGLIDDEEEMNEFAAKGYTPAKGNEKIMENPFLEGGSRCGPGKTKVRGRRILMCIPKEVVNARKAAILQEIAKRKPDAKKDIPRMRKEDDLPESVGIQPIEETIAN